MMLALAMVASQTPDVAAAYPAVGLNVLIGISAFIIGIAAACLYNLILDKEARIFHYIKNVRPEVAAFAELMANVDDWECDDYEAVHKPTA